MSTTPGIITGKSVAPAEDSGNGVDDMMECVPGAGADTQADTSGSTNDTSVASEDLSGEAYKVTIVSVKDNGAFFTKVIDSRFDDIESAWEEIEKPKETEKTAFRLVMAEDLPVETETLLEKVLHGDRKILADHAANKDDVTLGWQERRFQTSRAEFHENLSEPPAALSVALPYEIHGKRKLPMDGSVHRTDQTLALETRDYMNKVMDRMQISPRCLRTPWLAIPSRVLGIQESLYIAYRRISIQFEPAQLPRSRSEEPAMCVILIYPPLLPVQASDVDVRVPADLVYPSTIKSPELTERYPIISVGNIDMPCRSANIVHHFAITTAHRGQNSFSEMPEMATSIVWEWITVNTQATFRESIKVSVDYWCFVLSVTRERSFEDNQQVIKRNAELVARFSEAIVTKLRQLEKARVETTRGAAAIGFSHVKSHYEHEWKRLSSSLNSILADVEKLLQQMATDTQLKMTSMQIEESRTAVEQAETVKRLTRLAFLFIPISATCSAFGMNVQELAHRPPPLWISLLVMLGITITTIFCSTETTHNVLWAVAKILEPLMPSNITRTLMRPKTVWETLSEAFAYDRTSGARPRWLPDGSNEWLKRTPRPMQPFLYLVRLLYYLCRIPFIAVERLAWTGAEYKRRRQEARRYAYLRGRTYDGGEHSQESHA